MAESIYQLQIWCSSVDTLDRVSEVLCVQPNRRDMGETWCFEVIEKEKDAYFDFVNRFMDILDGKYQNLSSLGISRNDISIWFLYQYDEQCNMEFSPDSLKRLGEYGITLCISCWES